MKQFTKRILLSLPLVAVCSILSAVEPNDGIQRVKTETPPNNEIWYTTTDGQPIELTYGDYIGFRTDDVVSHTYANGKGIIRLSQDLYRLRDATFESWNNINSLQLPESVEEIGVGSLSGCKELTSFVVPSRVKRIEEATFSGLSELLTVSLPSGLEEICDRAFVNCRKLQEATLPEGLTKVGTQAFERCLKLPVTLPESVTEVGGRAFGFCQANQTISNSRLFVYCNEETRGKVTIPEGIEEVTSGAMTYSKASSIILPSTLKRIDSEAFYRIEQLYSIEIPEGCVRIEDNAFTTCWSLRDIKLPNSLRYLSGFAECAMETMDIPYGVEEIGDNGLAFNSLLRCVHIPATVQTIAWNAFRGNTVMDSLMVDWVTPPTIHEETFYLYQPIPRTLFVPKGTLETYKNAPVWKDFGTIVEREEETAISGIEAQPTAAPIYNLNGQKISQPNGVYIQGGKKYRLSR